MKECKCFERGIIETNTRVIIQVSIGSFLVCDETITRHYYYQHASKDFCYELHSNHYGNYEFIKEIFEVAKKMEAPIKIIFNGPGIYGCTFCAPTLSSDGSEYCVDRFFKSWAEAWGKAMSLKGRLLKEANK